MPLSPVSCLNNCNGLLYGLPDNAVVKLQRVQKAAARILYCAPRFSHITPLLYELHWLPVKYGVECKLIILTFKRGSDLAPSTSTATLLIYPSTNQMCRTYPINQSNCVKIRKR